MVELTEKWLLSAGGWQAWQVAKKILAEGRVQGANYNPPSLKGKVQEGRHTYPAGLLIRSNLDVTNLCPCRESRQHGIICGHSIAVGLAFLNPSTQQKKTVSTGSVQETAQAGTDEKPQITLRLSGSLRSLRAVLEFAYSRSGVANRVAEEETKERLRRAGFEEKRGEFLLNDEEQIIHFLAFEFNNIKKLWKIVEESLTQKSRESLTVLEPAYAVRSNPQGWLEMGIHFQAQGEALISYEEVRRLLQTGRKSFSLKGGKRAVLNPAQVEHLEEVLHDCDPHQTRPGFYEIAPAHRDYLSLALSFQPPSKNSEIPPQTWESLQKFLRADLREYQKQGVGWMYQIAGQGFGGILADEMGLGKTVQALALLAILQKKLQAPALVVCPSTLVENWRREAQRFLPEWDVRAITGPKRKGLMEHLTAQTLLITSYALLRLDISHYQNTYFSIIYTDEGQYLKNPDTDISRAVRRLKAHARFVLTGTPLENSPGDLWSLFDFFLPGYLGSRKDFQQRYEKPLLENPDPMLSRRLRARIEPYLLRRTKQNVLKEIPEKIIQVTYCELTKNQKSVYSSLLQAARGQWEQFQQDKKSGSARMAVFTALLRLRQACCDLRLLKGEDGIPPEEASAKRELLLELLREARESGDKVLVFSQFSSLLHLCLKDLQQNGFQAGLLEGATRDRMALVDRFQNTDDWDALLISLKAGGTGLNLTRASVVILMDPWWNPAAEAQAIDRAHRIGQQKAVNVYKLATAGTVEEKILELQSRKSELARDLVDAAKEDDLMTASAPDNADIEYILS